MEFIDIMPFVIKLTQADIISGFITNEPVMGNRDELIKDRIETYIKALETLIADYRKEYQDKDEVLLFRYLHSAIELTSAEICCLYISLKPVLYDRDDMIVERVNFHMKELINWN